jgi:membrane protease YdiL (CAAX protease family)
MGELDTINFEKFYKSKNFPYISFSIFSTIAIVMLMAFGQAGLLIIVPEHWENALKALIIGFAQLGLMLVPVLIISEKLPIGRNSALRINTNIHPAQYLYSIIGLVALQFFFFGYISIQDALIPESLKDIYNKLSEQFESLYLSILDGENTWELLRAMFVGALIPAVSEEALFRGFLQRSLEEKMKPFNAILIASVIFGLVHFNPINLIPLICIGIFLGALAYYTRSLLLPILVHFLNNVFSILALYSPGMEKMSNDMELLPMMTAIPVLIFGLVFTILAIIMTKRRSAAKA